MPGTENIIIYGVPWIALVSVIVGIAKYFGAQPSPKVEAIIKAASLVVGYFLVMWLPEIEQIAPAISVWLPQVMAAILLFGAMLGITPVVDMAARRMRAFFGRGG